jgi:hypothetical protein
LKKIADYRKQIALEKSLLPEIVSILIVLGTEDTEDLEAQVRGSRYAWDIRLLGIKSLVKLLKLKETLDDPTTETQIQEILIPQEFTRLDGIIDLVFATAKDVQSEEEVGTPETDDEIIQTPRVAANFHPSILPRLERHFGSALVKQGRVLWSAPDNSILLSCQVSKEFDRNDMQFWFGLKRSTEERLAQNENSFCAFGLGTPDRVVLLPFSVLRNQLGGLFTSPEDDGSVRHWHIRFRKDEQRIILLTNRDREQMDVTSMLLRT